MSKTFTIDEVRGIVQSAYRSEALEEANINKTRIRECDDSETRLYGARCLKSRILRALKEKSK